MTVFAKLVYNIDSSAKNGTPVTCLLYTILLSWVSEVALDHNLQLAILWIQPASELLHLLSSIERPKVLVNTFDALEEETLKEIDGKIDMVAVGPLIPSAFLDGNDPTDRSFGVAFPKWSDQSTNAKLIEDVWRMGTRVHVAVNEDGDVDGEEIRRCIEMVMGEHERGETMRKNAKKWKDLASKAVKQTGSSYINLKAFVEQSGSTFDLLKDKNGGI
ncbi:hypothetical protein R6Q59_007546 [Mikania micrantha]